MDILQSAFIFALLLCTLYAGINGGRTGKAGAAIFIVATILSAAAAEMNPSWATTSYGLFAVDGGCLLALIVLALHSNRYWPIGRWGFKRWPSQRIWPRCGFPASSRNPSGIIILLGDTNPVGDGDGHAQRPPI
jgi:hypothetical protein